MTATKKTRWLAASCARSAKAVVTLWPSARGSGAPTEKTALEVQKLQAEVEKLEAEVALLRKKGDLDVAKVEGEIREQRRHFVFRNVAPVATLLVGILGIGGTVWLNNEASGRDRYRRVHEGIARQLLVRLSEASSADRLAAARQLGQLDSDITYTVLEDGYSSSLSGNKSRADLISNQPQPHE